MTKQVILQTKPTSTVGPDGIYYRYLKNLVPVANRDRTAVFSFSIRQITIPNIWKLGKIVPILKQVNHRRNHPPIDQYHYFATLFKSLRAWSLPASHPTFSFHPLNTALEPNTLLQHFSQDYYLPFTTFYWYRYL